MKSTKQSNWILGFGIVVAIALLIVTFWFKSVPSEPTNTLIKEEPDSEIGQSIYNVRLEPVKSLATILKTLY